MKQIILKAPGIDKTIVWGYFNSACQGDPSNCGVGGISILLFKETITRSVSKQL
jgi:hypothetical protein